jgi:hypothetical protein
MKRLRMALALAGVGLAAVGVFRNDRRLVWIAIALLIVAWVFRIWSARSERRPPTDNR